MSGETLVPNVMDSTRIKTERQNARLEEASVNGVHDINVARILVGIDTNNNLGYEIHPCRNGDLCKNIDTDKVGCSYEDGLHDDRQDGIIVCPKTRDNIKVVFVNVAE